MTGHDWQNHSPLPITLRNRGQRVRVAWTTNDVLRAQGPRETTAPGLAINDQRLTSPHVVHHPHHHGLTPLHASAATWPTTRQPGGDCTTDNQGQRLGRQHPDHNPLPPSTPEEVNRQ
jgi:hypothetical protein